jgi:hypothetical protein
VIDALVIMLNEKSYIANIASETLVEMGQRAATSAIINGLLIYLSGNPGYTCTKQTLSKLLTSSPSFSYIDSNALSQLLQIFKEDWWRLRDIPLEKMVLAFSNTKIIEWCSFISLHSLYTASAITISKQTIILHNNKEAEHFADMPITISDERRVASLKATCSEQ